MPDIKILPVNLRNKIAAGEVVERPASVVKELMENSIDAGASRIEIDISKAGKRLIRVSDNGIGMDKEDALLAFERHATSKIKNEEDLFNITTMGFRGEALASIASVSKVKIATSLQKRTGTCIEIIGGDMKDVKECSAIGTTIEIRDIFFNTPARQKFLKSDSAENYHIIDTVTRQALSHFKTGFILRIDGSEALNLPHASSLRERIMHIFGKEFADGLIETYNDSGGIVMNAFLGKTTNLRNNKNSQFVFINDRPVKDQSVSYAVYKAYEELIPKDKHPVFILFISMDPRRVDFNVHPTKREVRFENKNIVFDFVYGAAREILRNGAIGHIPYSHNPPIQYSAPAIVSETASLYDIIAHVDGIPFLYLGDTIVAIAEKGGLTLIDYHAAHERINYERLLKKIEMPSYKLLFPAQVRLQGREYMMILKNLDNLNELGIEAEDFGHETIIVRSLPEFLRDADLNALLGDIAASLSSEISGGVESIDSAKKTLAARLACHSSIRGKEVPDGIRIARLLKDLSETDNPNACPHGRPTRIFISPDELKKMFKK
jgi:DNA mismatch repair protein MutL